MSVQTTTIPTTTAEIPTTTAERSVNQSYPALAESVPLARNAVGAFAAEAGVAGDRLESIRLVVSEAVSNAVLHAYDDIKGEIHVTAAAVPGELWILIADDGAGLRAEGSDNRGLGLGLGWMAQFSDGFTLLTRSSGGLEVRLRFELFEGATDSEGSPAGVASLC
jgi:stage II sporulation protein AB (anti-sigma F factor)